MSIRLHHPVRSFSAYVSRAAVSRDGRIAVSISEMMLEISDVESGRELRSMAHYSQWSPFPCRMRNVVLTGDGRIALSSSLDIEGVQLWDVESGRELCTVSSYGCIL